MLKHLYKSFGETPAVLMISSAYAGNGLRVHTFTDQGTLVSRSITGLTTGDAIDGYFEQFAWSSKVSNKWYLAVCNTEFWGGPTYHEYDGSSFTTMTTDTSYLSTTAAAWNSDGSKLVVGVDGSPWLALYSRSGTSLTLGSVSGVRTSPHRKLFWVSDTLVIALTQAHGIVLYDVSGTSLSFNSAPLGSFECYGGDLSPDKQYLAVSTSSNGAVFKLTGTSLSGIASTGATTIGMKFSPDGTKLACSFPNSPYFAVYDIISETLYGRSLSYTSNLFGPWGTTRGSTIVWSRNSRYIWYGSTDFSNGAGAFIWDVPAALFSTVTEKSMDTFSVVWVSADGTLT